MPTMKKATAAALKEIQRRISGFYSDTFPLRLAPEELEEAGREFRRIRDELVGQLELELNDSPEALARAIVGRYAAETQNPTVPYAPKLMGWIAAAIEAERSRR